MIFWRQTTNHPQTKERHQIEMPLLWHDHCGHAITLLGISMRTCAETAAAIAERETWIAQASATYL